MDIEPFNTFDILAMLDVPVLADDQVMGYIDISMIVCSTNPAWIQDNGHWVAILFDSFGRPTSYFGFEDFIKTMLRGCTMTLSCNYQSPIYVDIT